MRFKQVINKHHAPCQIDDLTAGICHNAVHFGHNMPGVHELADVLKEWSHFVYQDPPLTWISRLNGLLNNVVSKLIFHQGHKVTAGQQREGSVR